MNPNLIWIGALAMTLAVAPAGNAYHMTGNATGGGFSTYNWGPRIGVSNTLIGPGQFAGPDPTGPLCTLVASLTPPVGPILYAILCDPTTNTVTGLTGGEVLFGLIPCEQEDASDEIIGGFGLTGVSVPGVGGLCYMSAGCTDAGVTGTTRSNGKYKDYSLATTATQACKAWVPAGPNFLPSPAVGQTNLVKITMCPSSTASYAGGVIVAPSQPTCVGGSFVTFSAQIGGLCSRTESQFVYDDVFAYSVNNGHVAGFPTSDPPPGQLGTYTVAASPGPASALHGEGGSCGNVSLPSPWRVHVPPG
jgi:hypothetical protein